LGYGNTDTVGDDEIPADMPALDLGGAATALVAGFHHFCAILDGGSVRCWGGNSSGQLGYGHASSIGDDESPSADGPVPLAAPAVELAAGQFFSCARLAGGDVKCWGANNYGQLGAGHTNDLGDDEALTAEPIELGSPARTIAAGFGHACAALEDGGVRCWGHNAAGKLGLPGWEGHLGDDELPTAAEHIDVGGSVIQLAAGADHTCALLETGNVRCWGAGSYLGYGEDENVGDNTTPASAGDLQLGGTASRIAVGHQHTCALLEDATVRCWGENHRGRLGYPGVAWVGRTDLPANAGAVSVF
jgi:alpha-tubulin suppressor-like RCC1 family protein